MTQPPQQQHLLSSPLDARHSNPTVIVDGQEWNLSNLCCNHSSNGQLQEKLDSFHEERHYSSTTRDCRERAEPFNDDPVLNKNSYLHGSVNKEFGSNVYKLHPEPERCHGTNRSIREYESLYPQLRTESGEDIYEQDSMYEEMPHTYSSRRVCNEESSYPPLLIESAKKHWPPSNLTPPALINTAFETSFRDPGGEELWEAEEWNPVPLREITVELPFTRAQQVERGVSKSTLVSSVCSSLSLFSSCRELRHKDEQVESFPLREVAIQRQISLSTMSSSFGLRSNFQKHNHTERSIMDDQKRDPADPDRILIEVFPGLDLPLRGSEETMQAIEVGFIGRAKCMECSKALGCIGDAEYVLCPSCRCVSPMQPYGDRKKHVFGIGLGFESLGLNS